MPSQMTLTCPACSTPFSAMVESIVDATDAEAKSRLLSGRINALRCPNCGTPVAVATPILYHDAAKELLIVFVPPELNLKQDQREKLVGDLMRDLTNRLPQHAMRGYMFTPRQALTMQGLIEQVLNADGVTPDMLERQRARVRIIESLLAADEGQLPDLIANFDDQIDIQLIQTMAMMAQRVLEDGRADVAEQIIAIQNAVVRGSSAGKAALAQEAVQEQVIAEVAAVVNTLPDDPVAARDQILELVQQYVGDDARLQALVGMARPLFDYGFFEMLTAAIAAAPSDQRATLEATRDRLLDMSARVDQQAQAALQAAADFLRMVVGSPNPAAFIEANLDRVDETFLAVLEANLDDANKRGDRGLLQRLNAVYEQAMGVIRRTMRPELQLINALLSAPDDETASDLLAQNAVAMGAPLLQMMDNVSQMLADRGEQEMLAKLVFLRQQAAAWIGTQS